MVVCGPVQKLLPGLPDSPDAHWFTLSADGTISGSSTSLPEGPGHAIPNRLRQISAKRSKKTLPEAVTAESQAHPTANIETWSFDEHRVGLQPIIRRGWAKKRIPFIAPVRPRYQWLYLYAFVNPSTGESFWLLLPSINIRLMSLALTQFAQWSGAGSKRRILLVMDRAGWHTSKQLVMPNGITPILLPPYTPELQPAERLWALSDEPLANRAFNQLDHLEALLVQRCQFLNAHPELVRKRAYFHWWPPSIQRSLL